MTVVVDVVDIAATAVTEAADGRWEAWGARKVSKNTSKAELDYPQETDASLHPAKNCQLLPHRQPVCLSDFSSLRKTR